MVLMRNVEKRSRKNKRHKDSKLGRLYDFNKRHIRKGFKYGKEKCNLKEKRFEP